LAGNLRFEISNFKLRLLEPAGERFGPFLLLGPVPRGCRQPPLAGDGGILQVRRPRPQLP